MIMKKRVLDRLITKGFDTKGKCYFYFLENYTYEELREIEKELEGNA